MSLLEKIMSKISVKAKENTGLIMLRIQDQAAIKYLLCLTNIKTNLKRKGLQIKNKINQRKKVRKINNEYEI
jgi:hypothetical protein